MHYINTFYYHYAKTATYYNLYTQIIPLKIVFTDTKDSYNVCTQSLFMSWNIGFDSRLQRNIQYYTEISRDCYMHQLIHAL